MRGKAESICTSYFSLHGPSGNRSCMFFLTLMYDKSGTPLLENPPGVKWGLQPQAAQWYKN